MLLRQTSFRALAEPRSSATPTARRAPAPCGCASARSRQRGIALTPRGRALYDRLVARGRLRGAADADRRPRSCGGGTCRRPSAGSREHGLAFFTYQPCAGPARDGAGRRPCPRAGATRAAIAPTDRLRGLPAALGGRHLPVQPHRRGHHATRAARPPATTARWLAGRHRPRPCTTPCDLYARAAGRVAARPPRTSSASGRPRPSRRDDLEEPTHDRQLDRHVPIATRTAELRDLAADALRRCGADPAPCPATAASTPVSPVTGETVADGALRATPATSSAAIAAAHAAFLAWRTVPAPARGELVKRLGELLTRAPGRPRRPRRRRGRQDRLRGPRRGPGDDRHLRLRRRPVPPADGRTMPSERPGHRLMETWHPLGRRRRDLRVQLPGGGVGVERGDRPGLRRHGGVEAVGADAADRRSPAPALLDRAAARGRRARRAAPVVARRTRRSASRWSTTRASRWSAPPAPTGWAGGRAAGRRPLRPHPARARRQQRRRGRAVGGPRPRRARHRVLRRRHRRPAVHDACAA